MSHQRTVSAGLSVASRSRSDENQHIAALIGRFIAALNCTFVVLFAYLAVWPLAAAYLASLLFDIWLWHVVRHSPDLLDRLLAGFWLVVLAQSLIAVWVLGADAGFQYYLLGTIPAAFARTDRSMSGKLLQTGLIIVFFIVCDSWLLRYAVPLYPYSEPVLAVLRHINIVGCCAILAASAHVEALVVKESSDALHRVASTDALTGLLNRRRFGEIAKREAARSSRGGHPLTLVLGDIDFFKRVNDGYGHAAGDHVLKTVSTVLLGAVREYDYVARWGGEEFIILLPDTDVTVAKPIVERLRQSVATSLPLFEGKAIAVSMTLGVAQFADDESWDAIVARTDEALYRGKVGGRNRVEIG